METNLVMHRLPVSKSLVHPSLSPGPGGCDAECEYVHCWSQDEETSWTVVTDLTVFTDYSEATNHPRHTPQIHGTQLERTSMVS